jgi:hypothetical protein
MVDPNAVIRSLISSVPNFQGLAPNSGGLFGGAEVVPISSGATTRAIISAGQTRQATPTLEAIFPSIQSNFAAIKENFESIGQIFQNIGQAPAQTIPTSQVPQPKGTIPTQPSGPSDIRTNLAEGFESIKGFLGPTGITLLLIGGGLLVVTGIIRSRS